MLPTLFTPQYLKQIELLRIHSRRTFLGSRQGSHLSQKRGHGIEFSDYRKYELGDSPRHIDWGVYGRSDRLYVRTFREEQDLSVLLLLDTSASMMTPVSDRKWETARDIALSLGYIALMDKDAVLISALGYFHSPIYRSPKAFHRLSESMMKLKIGGNCDLRWEIQRAISRVRFPGKAVFISDFLMPLDELQSAFDLLRAKNLDITAIQVLGPNDLRPLEDLNFADVIDSETGEVSQIVLDPDSRKRYEDLLHDHNELLQKYFRESRISFARIDSGGDIRGFVVENLSRIGLLK